jgi:hypothetical protein
MLLFLTPRTEGPLLAYSVEKLPIWETPVRLSSFEGNHCTTFRWFVALDHRSNAVFSTLTIKQAH